MHAAESAQMGFGGSVSTWVEQNPAPQEPQGADTAGHEKGGAGVGHEPVAAGA